MQAPRTGQRAPAAAQCASCRAFSASTFREIKFSGAGIGGNGERFSGEGLKGQVWIAPSISTVAATRLIKYNKKWIQHSWLVSHPPGTGSLSRQRCSRKCQRRLPFHRHIIQAGAVDPSFVTAGGNFLSETLSHAAESVRTLLRFGNIAEISENLPVVIVGDGGTRVAGEAAENLFKDLNATIHTTGLLVEGSLQVALAAALASAGGAIIGSSRSNNLAVAESKDSRDNRNKQQFEPTEGPCEAVEENEGEGEEEGQITETDRSPDLQMQLSDSSFNRFVITRCPALRSSTSAVDFSALSGSRIKGRRQGGGRRRPLPNASHGVELIGLQRSCLLAADGGVVAMDWASDVSLTDDNGMETTVLVVAGTPEGSADLEIRAFAEAARCQGLFAVILNPRGCGGSPLTSPRLFSPADSADVLLAAEYLSIKRPLSPLFAVGWGEGGSMIIRHLGEAGLQTPIAAAVTIGAPLCLHEAAVSLERPINQPQNTAITDGLKQLLRAHQMLFEGTRSGFGVEAALGAKSVREFDRAIRRVSLACDSMDEYYQAVSCQNALSKVQIPLLCIQAVDDAQAPLLALPLPAMKANPSITLAVATSFRHEGEDVRGSLRRGGWRVDAVLQWLAAVEVALLKGKRPDDQAGPPLPHVKPPGFLSWGNGRESAIPLVELEDSGATPAAMDGRITAEDEGLEAEFCEIPEAQIPENSASVSILREAESAQRTVDEVFGNCQEEGDITGVTAQDERESGGEKQDDKGQENPPPPAPAPPPPPPPPGSTPEEAGRARATAESVLNMLDITRPGILQPEQKQKALAAVGRGESLVNALQGAVPEDVRGTLTTAMQEAMKASNINFSLVGLPHPSLFSGSEEPSPSPPTTPLPQPTPSATSTEESGKSQASGESNGETKSFPSTAQTEESGKNQSEGKEGRKESEVRQKGVETKGEGSEGGSSEGSGGAEGVIEADGIKEKESKDDVKVKVAQNTGDDILSTNEKPDVTAKGVVEHSTVSTNDEGAEKNVKDEGSEKVNDQTQKGESENSGEEKKVKGEKEEGKIAEDKSKDPTPAVAGAAVNAAAALSPPAARPATPQKQIDMRMAMEALTGLDDSTQMAVTNVLGVVDSMLSRLEMEQKEATEGDGSVIEESEERVEVNEGEENEGSARTEEGDAGKLKKVKLERDDGWEEGQGAAASLEDFNGGGRVIDVGQDGNGDGSGMGVRAEGGMTEEGRREEGGHSGVTQKQPEIGQGNGKVVDEISSRNASFSSGLNPNSPGREIGVQEKHGGSPMQLEGNSGESDAMGARSEKEDGTSINRNAQGEGGREKEKEKGSEISNPSSLNDLLTDVREAAVQKNFQPRFPAESVGINGTPRAAGRAVVAAAEVNGSYHKRSKEGGAADKHEDEQEMVKARARALADGILFPDSVLGKSSLASEGLGEPSRNGLSHSEASKQGNGPHEAGAAYLERRELSHKDGKVGVGLGGEKGKTGSEESGRKDEQLLREGRTAVELSNAEGISQERGNTGREIGRKEDVMPVLEQCEERSGRVHGKARSGDEEWKNEWVNREEQQRQEMDIEIETVSERKADIGGLKVLELVGQAVKFELLRRLGEVFFKAFGLNVEEKAGTVMRAMKATIFASRDSEESRREEPGLMQLLGKPLGSVKVVGELQHVHVGLLFGLAMVLVGIVVVALKKILQDQEKEKLGGEFVPERNDRNEGMRGIKETENGGGETVAVSIRGENRVGGNWHHGQEGEDAKAAVEVEGGGPEMVGVMAAAVGASAAFGGNAGNLLGEKAMGTEDREGTNNQRGEHEGDDIGRTGSGENEGPFDALAEKAMSVASPVIPRGQDGAIDQERLVAMLAEFGQRGGMLRLVGKGALLWGGLRGATALVERLIGFLRIRQRPLAHRLVAFLAMAVLLWTPVLVPLLPSLLQQWATSSPAPVTNAALAVGLYGAFFLLVRIWGEKVREYERPLATYGLRLLSRERISSLFVGLGGGIALVGLLSTAQLALGYVILLRPINDVHVASGLAVLGARVVAVLKLSRLIVEALAMGLAVAVVEEVLFRAWLQEEVAADLGYHGAAIIGAVVFAVVHKCPQALLGLALLSLILTGLREKAGGNLASPIGLHAGLIAANFVRDAGGFMAYVEGHPTWMTGANVQHPLGGVMGVAMLLPLVIMVYPWARPAFDVPRSPMEGDVRGVAQH